MEALRTPGPARLGLRGLDHLALIAGDYALSKAFYVDILGFRIVAETYRADRDSWKLDLIGPGGLVLEVFSFPGAPPRPTRPEARGLRHLALSVEDLDGAVAGLAAQGLACEPIRWDEVAARRFTFFFDPDGLPVELCEAAP